MLLPENASITDYNQTIRLLAAQSGPNTGGIRAYWQKEFDKPVIKVSWTRLVEEVENAS